MATVKLNKQVSDKVRELNALGTFLADIRLGAVARKLSEIPVDKALEVLNSVVEAAEGGDESAQQDPTMAVTEAATKKAEEDQAEDQEQEIEVEEAPPEEAAPDAEPEENAEPWNDETGDKEEQKWPEEWDKEDAEWNDDAETKEEKDVDLSDAVRQKVLQLNRSGKLCSEIDLSKVESGLAQVSEPIALQLLKDIFDTADMVDKPNNLIGDACRKIALSGRGAASEKVAHQIGNLMRRIRWVNSNISLSFPLHMGNVLDILQPLHHADAMAAQGFLRKVIKKLVQNADDIDAPQSWLRKEAKWVQDNPEKAKEQRKGGGKGGNNKWDNKKDNKKDWNNKKDWDSGKKDDKWDKKWDNKKAGGTIRANAPVTAYGKNDNGGPSKWQKTGNSWEEKKAGNDKPWKDWGKKEDKKDSWSQQNKKSWK